MTVEQLHSLYYGEPFEPFEFCLDDGRTIPIESPRRFGYNRYGNLVMIQRPDQEIEFLDRRRLSVVLTSEQRTGDGRSRMTTRWLRYFGSARPFQAFTLHLADDRVIEVTHPEQLLEQMPTRTCVIGISAGSALIIDLPFRNYLKSTIKWHRRLVGPQGQIWHNFGLRPNTAETAVPLLREILSRRCSSFVSLCPATA